MSALVVSDSDLPGLERLMGPMGIDDLRTAICRSTHNLWSFERLQIVRFRHRPGQRAVLQVDTTLSGPFGRMKAPASIWFHAGGKSQKIVRRLEANDNTVLRPPSMFLEPRSGGLVQFFPFDHRVPEIATFVREYERFAVQLFGHPIDQVQTPRLARFRPGLGATFRWLGSNSQTIYVKVFPRTDRKNLLPILDRFNHESSQLRFKVPQVTGRAAEISAEAIQAAPGRGFDEILTNARTQEVSAASKKIVDGLADFHMHAPAPEDRKDHKELVRRAKRASGIVGSVSSELGKRATSISNWIEQSARPLPAKPAHMDMKTEHLVVDDRSCTILDLDSMALSDPTYDLIMLEARISDAATCGRCSVAQADAALASTTNALKVVETERLQWLRAVCALQIARHHAQSGNTNWPCRVANALDQWKIRTAGNQ